MTARGTQTAIDCASEAVEPAEAPAMDLYEFCVV